MQDQNRAVATVLSPQCSMAFYRRRAIGKRKFRALERDAGERVVTFIPRRMDLVPEAVKCALPLYYSEEMCLFNRRFPLPIYRTINLMRFDWHWFRRIMFSTGGVDPGEFLQRFPNNHWSVDHPFGVSAVGLPYLASKYQHCVLNGSKATIAVAVRMRFEGTMPLDTVAGEPGHPGIPIDCWLGSPASPAEVLALRAFWQGIRFLQEMDENTDTSQTFTQRQFNDEKFYAKNLYGSSNQLDNPTDLDSLTEMPWGAVPILRPGNGSTTDPARPSLRWLMQQTVEEGPNRFRHKILFPKSPASGKLYGHSAEMKAVYNPQAYWGSFIKTERIVEADLEDKVDPQDHMDAIKLYELNLDTQSNVPGEAWSTAVDSAPSSNPVTIDELSPPTNVIATNTLFTPSVATEANGEGGGYAYNQLMPHLWVYLQPHNTTDSPNVSWAWPEFPTDDLDATELYRRQGLTFTFGVKQKFYMIFTNRRDTEDMNDVLIDD